ncbi:hypothetical protein [Streptomyces sp. NPDC004266]|uniref:hypothetical protein n=1 Tax=Streptomyces sp. NPDC004266 TaxID=3364693 RepID=UPI0036C0612B
MTEEVKKPSEGLVPVLEHHGLFQYAPNALEVVERFCQSWGEYESELADDLPLVKNLILLSAAEYSLIPSFLDGSYSRPVPVRDVDAKLAVLKCDTTPSILIHKHAKETGTPAFVSAADLSVFSSDVAKLYLKDPDWWESLHNPADLWKGVEYLEEAHIRCPWPSLQALAETKLLRVQGLIWQLRLTVANRHGFDEAISGVVSDFVHLRFRHS